MFCLFVVFVSFRMDRTPEIHYPMLLTSSILEHWKVQDNLLQYFSLCLCFFLLVRTQGVAACSADPEMTTCYPPAHCVTMSSNVSCVCGNGYAGDPPQCEG